MAVVVAALVLALAIPRLRASVHFLPVDTAIQRYFQTGDLPSAQLGALERRAREAIALHPHYRYYDGLSFIAYLQALDARGKPWLVRPALVRTRDAGRAAVARAPAKPRTWLRIARAEAGVDTAPEAVIAALKLSMLTGRVEPTLLVPRLELAYAYLERLDPETRSLLRDQTLLGWRVSERAFRRALAEGRIDLARVGVVLGPADSAVLAAMGQGA